jgi:deoxyadenosine/deoxycytidine kinase
MSDQDTYPSAERSIYADWFIFSQICWLKIKIDRSYYNMVLALVEAEAVREMHQQGRTGTEMLWIIC